MVITGSLDQEKQPHSDKWVIEPFPDILNTYHDIAISMETTVNHLRAL